MNNEKKKAAYWNTGANGLRQLLLIVACFPLIVLFPACPSGGENPLPAGKGSFTLRLGDKTMRTVLPATPALTDFDVFNLDFVPTVPGVALNIDLPSPASGSFAPIILVEGTYNLTVSAYKTENAPEYLAAQGTLLGINITAGSIQTGTVDLKAQLAGNGSNKGSFAWNITLSTTPTVVSTAEMTIIDSSNTAVGVPVDLTTTSTGNSQLDPGVYTVTFNLEGIEGTDKKKALVWNELVYVYATLTSTFTHTFSDSYFSRTHWNVTLDYDTNSQYDTPSGITYTYPNMTIPNATQSVIHGDNLNNPNPLPAPTKDGYRFDGWFTNQACTTPWTLSSAIHEDMTLWAGWTANTDTLTLTVEAITDPTAGETFPAITVSRGKTTPLTSAVSVSGSYDSITWEIDGVGVYPAITDATDATTFTINGANNNYNTPGGHVLRLTVEKGGKAYLVNIPFTVVD